MISFLHTMLTELIGFLARFLLVSAVLGIGPWNEKFVASWATIRTERKFRRIDSRDLACEGSKSASLRPAWYLLGTLVGGVVLLKGCWTFPLRNLRKQAGVTEEQDYHHGDAGMNTKLTERDYRNALSLCKIVIF